MARVNVDSQACNDARFAVLASLMGSDEPDLALGRMVRVWMQCLERETYTLTGSVICALFNGNPDASNWLVEAELAEPVEGGFRIKGTQGRIEYLAEKRANGKRYGPLGAKYGKRGGRPRKNPQTGGVRNPPPAPAPAPAPAQEKKKPPTPLQGGDELLSAIAEATGTDPTTNARAIARTARLLLKATPPYTPADVIDFARRYWQLCPYAKDKIERPSPAEIAKRIGLVRVHHKAAGKTKAQRDAEIIAQREKHAREAEEARRDRLARQRTGTGGQP